MNSNRKGKPWGLSEVEERVLEESGLAERVLEDTVGSRWQA